MKPGTQIPFPDADQVRELFAHVVKRAITEQGWQPILDIVRLGTEFVFQASCKIKAAIPNHIPDLLSWPKVVAHRRAAKLDSSQCSVLSTRQSQSAERPK